MNFVYLVILYLYPFFCFVYSFSMKIHKVRRTGNMVANLTTTTKQNKRNTRTVHVTQRECSRRHDFAVVNKIKRKQVDVKYVCISGPRVISYLQKYIRMLSVQTVASQPWNATTGKMHCRLYYFATYDFLSKRVFFFFHLFALHDFILFRLNNCVV